MCVPLPMRYNYIPIQARVSKTSVGVGKMNIGEIKNEVGVLHLVILSLPPFPLRLPATDSFVIGCMQVSQFLLG